MYIEKYLQTYSEISTDSEQHEGRMLFPNSLLMDILMSEAVERGQIVPDLYGKRSSISNYPDLIRHAGQFLTIPLEI